MNALLGGDSWAINDDLLKAGCWYFATQAERAGDNAKVAQMPVMR